MNLSRCKPENKRRDAACDHKHPVEYAKSCTGKAINNILDALDLYSGDENNGMDVPKDICYETTDNKTDEDIFNAKSICFYQ